MVKKETGKEEPAKIANLFLNPRYNDLNGSFFFIFNFLAKIMSHIQLCDAKRVTEKEKEKKEGDREKCEKAKAESNPKNHNQRRLK